MQHTLKVAHCTKLLNKHNIVAQHVRGLSNLRMNIDKLLSQKEEFQARHIGPREHEQMEMLRLIGFKVTYSCKIFFWNEKKYLYITAELIFN